MESLSQVIPTIILVVSLVGIGIGVRAAQWLRPEDANRIFPPLINNVFLPAVVFNGIKKASSTDITGDVLKVPLIAFIVISLSGLIAYLVGRLLKLPRRQMGAFLLTSMFGSTAFVGLPLVTGIYQDGNTNKGLLVQPFYSEIGNLTLLMTVGIIIAAFYGEGARFSWSSLLAIPKSGSFIAMVLAFLFYKENIPAPITATLNALSQVTLPLMMFLVGVTIVWKDITKSLPAIISLNIIKLLIAPVIGLVLAQTLGLNPIAQGVILINAATPSIIFCLAYAQQYKLDSEFASTAVFSSFFFSVVTLGIISFLLPAWR